jgi:hypothetical protein
MSVVVERFMRSKDSTTTKDKMQNKCGNPFAEMLLPPPLPLGVLMMLLCRSKERADPLPVPTSSGSRASLVLLVQNPSPSLSRFFFSYTPPLSPSCTVAELLSFNDDAFVSRLATSRRPLTGGRGREGGVWNYIFK